MWQKDHCVLQKKVHEYSGQFRIPKLIYSWDKLCWNPRFKSLTSSCSSRLVYKIIYKGQTKTEMFLIKIIGNVLKLIHDKDSH